jgi:hypothetical protein
MKKKLGKKVRCVETGEVYYSMEYAGRQVGVDRSSISRVCSGKARIAGGYHWEFIN